MRIIQNRDIHTEIVLNGILKATRFVWIATANLKDLHIREGGRHHSILDSFTSMANAGISIRVIHAAEPSGPFRASFDKHRELIRGDVEFLLCPRLHFKIVVVDGRLAYTGSANFTGAGLGGRSEHRRNFEVGVLFNDQENVATLMNAFDRLWMGEPCPTCAKRRFCPDPVE